MPLLAVGSLLVILFSGIYLVIHEADSVEAWPHVAVGALFLMTPFAAMTNSRMRAIRTRYGAEKTMSSALLSQLRDPFLKISLSIRIATLLGIFVLVTVKPRLWESISLVGVAMMLGLFSSGLPWRRASSTLSTD
jgi:hypothetical protein